MKTKKNGLDLGKSNHKFFYIGLIVAISSVITAFEWSFPVGEMTMKCIDVIEDPDEPMMVVNIPEPPRPEPIVINEPVDPPTIIDKVKPVPDDTKEEDESLKKLLEDPDDLKEVSGNGEVVEIIEDETVEPPHFAPGTPAEPTCGMNEFRRKVGKFIGRNVNERDRRVLGGGKVKMYTTFVVEKDGSLTDFKILKGSTSHLDKVVEEAVYSSCEWIAGKNAGRKIRHQFNLPVTIIL